MVDDSRGGNRYVRGPVRNPRALAAEDASWKRQPSLARRQAKRRVRLTLRRGGPADYLVFGRTDQSLLFLRPRAAHIEWGPAIHRLYPVLVVAQLTALSEHLLWLMRRDKRRFL